MLGYDYDRIYKKCWDNVLVNALSKKIEEEYTLLSLLFPIPSYIEEAHNEMFTHLSLSKIVKNLQVYPKPHQVILGRNIFFDINIVWLSPLTPQSEHAS